MNDSTPYMFRCPNCMTKNRIPQDKVGTIAKCGKCATRLDTKNLFLPQPVTITDGNFERMVIQSPLPVLLDCWAGWCGACTMLSPVIEALADEWKGRVRVGKLDVEANPLLNARFTIRSLPTLLIFDGGQLKDTLIGALPKPQIVQKMAPFI
ncbi:MAG: thiol reductase thioredoxin [Deltaproteobacteria bacterium]|nr:MAG: thiol reductase thioredoxin [Deltaproteobacteria bacterium]